MQVAKIFEIELMPQGLNDSIQFGGVVSCDYKIININQTISNIAFTMIYEE
jgi:hypothetical protein